MRGKKQETETEISVMEVKRGTINAYILGNTPIILNKMSDKARHQLLLPPPKMNSSERQSTLKHQPLVEFRASAHQLSDGPTLLAIQAAAFKRSLSSAALDMPGTKKAVIGRLTYVEGDYVHIYGVPKLLMSVVRSADIGRTPDIRSRVIIPNWAAKIHVSYVIPLLREKPVYELLAAAGLYVGVGDWRPEKGAGNFGQFTLVSSDDKTFNELLKSGGRKQQVAAMADPACYDDETSEMLAWFTEEVKRRGFVDGKKVVNLEDGKPYARTRKAKQLEEATA